MYDDNSPMMNRDPGPSIAISDDPHGVLRQISDVDTQILQLRKHREKLLIAYQEHMKGIEQHWNEVMQGPAETSDDDNYATPRNRY